MKIDLGSLDLSFINLIFNLKFTIFIEFLMI